MTGKAGDVAGNVPRLSEFAGLWRVTRDIRPAKGLPARFEGTARFAPDPEGLSYREEGTLRIPEQPPMQAERRYLWRAGGEGGIEVFFDDGRFFHRIAPGAPEDRHWCDPDTYDVRYDFGGWPAWSCVWVVRGPRKDYRMQSDYVRIAG